MSTETISYLLDNIGYVKYISKDGKYISIKFKMPVNIAYLWFNFIQAADFTDFRRSTITHTSDFWIPNINNKDVYIKSVNSSIDVYNMLLKAEEDAQNIHGIVPQSIYIEFTETGYLDDYIRLYEQCKKGSTLANGIYIYTGLIGKIIESAQGISEKVNVPNKICDNPAEYQWGC